MSMQTITQGMAAALGLTKDHGVIVSDVWPGGPAAAAGLAVGDILVSVDTQPAENLPTVSYNFRLRDSVDNVQLVVLRGAAIVSISIKPVEKEPIRKYFNAASLLFRFFFSLPVRIYSGIEMISIPRNKISRD